MKKIILLTGATDGIGLETAKMLVSQGHHVLLHGRNTEKLTKVEQWLGQLPGDGSTDVFTADISVMEQVHSLAEAVSTRYEKIDVLINNAGVYIVQEKITVEGLDMTFAVNTLAPYLLTNLLLPLMSSDSRVINLSSAAQASVDRDAIAGRDKGKLSDGNAYAQSKLALTMWSRHMALDFMHNNLKNGPSVIAVNPRSMLGSKMVKQAYGVNGGDLKIGADILCRAALSDEFSDASGKYYDNDRASFSSPHPDALNPVICEELVSYMDSLLKIRQS